MNSNLAEKLDEFLDEQNGIEENQGFVIDDMDKADWAVRKIASYQQKIDEVVKFAEKYTQQIEAWVEKETQDNLNQISFFESKLRPFAEEQLKGATKRSFKLPSGTVGFRKASPKFYIDGEPVKGSNEKLTKWVKENCKDFIVTKEETNWKDFKATLKAVKGKAVTADGEIIPEIVTDSPVDTFYVKGAEK